MTTVAKTRCRWSARPSVAIPAIFLTQLVLLAVAGWQHRHQLNPDGVAYMRIAGYWLEGNEALRISGYFAPLLSWLMVPFLALDIPSLATSRLVLALSAVGFLAGSVMVFRSLQLERAPFLWASGLTAAATIYWSIQNTVPDLLMGGLLCAATALVLSDRWPDSLGHQLAAGALFSLAYLAKAVAFPIALLIPAAVGAGRTALGLAPARRTVLASSVTVTVFLAGSSPWMATLSQKYDGFTIGTSGRIVHALNGPGYENRMHLHRRRYRVPDSGRVTQWEDASRWTYKTWSPFSSWSNFFYQWIRVAKNAVFALRNLLSFDLLGAGMAGLAVALFLPPLRRETWRRQRWRWAVLPAAVLCAVYLPVYAWDRRYFYPVFPFMLTAAFGLCTATHGAGLPGFFSRRLLLRGIVVFSFGWVIAGELVKALRYLPNNDAVIHAARKLRENNQVAPIADADGVDGLYIAFLNEVPWYGSKPAPAPCELLRSGAGLAVVQRNSKIDAALRGHDAFVCLNSVVFPAERTEFGRPREISLYEVRDESAPTACETIRSEADVTAQEGTSSISPN